MRQTNLSDRALVRLIPATYHKPPVLRGLVDNEAEAEILAEIEGLTNARLSAEAGNNPHFDPRELAWYRRKADLRVYGNTHVNAAFTYTRKGGNRFNTEDRGAWYCAWDVQVSIAEVAFHRTRELEFTGLFEDEARYVEIRADFIGCFDDITDEIGHAALHPDVEIGYKAGQNLAEELRRGGSRGLIYPSVRAPEGNCLVCFDPGAVQNVTPGASWDLVWDGSPVYTIENIA
ncbi:UNVERIFIED_ORG: RES domain-containing protein [Martelella mediterranea]